MIKCNLAVLLAERGLKMADIINDTPLSKTAVRGLYYNESKGIQYETLEILCDYLNVGPEDLIKKINFNHKLIKRTVDSKNMTIEYYISFNLDNKESEHVLKLRLEKIVVKEDEYSKQEILPGLYLDFIFTKDFKQSVLSQITWSERNKLEDTITSDFIASLNLENHPFRQMHYYDDLNS
ncbi:helix-turn-helix domain-containing protein [Solibacillus silvestris]|uniref:helix-turn-helix domain-containing protein n=1 Tax=Solibacillus silvestris TaxID=76853 RepID=UPI003F7E8032